MISSFKRNIPWWLRIGAKILLARLPVPYSVWKRLHFFEHGDMNQPQKAFGTVIDQARLAGVLAVGLPLPTFATKDQEFNVLELGPGDSLFTTVISKAMGASNTWLVDAGAFAIKNIDSYLGLINLLRKNGFSSPFVQDPQTLCDVLRECNGEYLTEGVISLSKLKSDSINFCFSNAVLEHIPKNDFEKLACELKRVMKPEGICFHRVDLKDHLGGGLNNLRFSDAIWEGAIFRNSGFYTNRIRFGEMVNIFESAGFDVNLPRVIRWDSLPIDHSKLDILFKQLEGDDLLVSGFDIMLKPKKVST